MQSEIDPQRADIGERFACGYGKRPSSIDVYRHIDHTLSLFFHSFCYQPLPLTTTTTSSIGAAVLSSVVRAAAALRLRKSHLLFLFSRRRCLRLETFLAAENKRGVVEAPDCFGRARCRSFFVIVFAQGGRSGELVTNVQSQRRVGDEADRYGGHDV